jgi:malonate-semialdehyde dehydrogenase (acetylating)/methylmalonate-semialdehyde dehydrogenase
VHAEARDRLVESARRMKVGNGLEPGVDMGPVISASHQKRVLAYVERGSAEGAKLALDGRQRSLPSEGFFVGPSVFDSVTPAMTIGREEISAVASICPVSSGVFH